MKREAAAAALLLLLIALTLRHLQTTDRLIGAVDRSLLRTEQAAGAGDYDKALEALEEGRRLWNGHRSYAQALFRHPDLDALQDAFSGLELALRQRDPAWPAALRLLRYHLEMLGQMEHPRSRSIF